MEPMPILPRSWLLILMLALPGQAEAQGEKVRGFDLETLAKATAQATAFSTEYGSAQGEANFDQWLRQQGLSLADYDAAYSAFLERFASDPSGRLEESYFKALDLYTPGERRPDLKDQAAPEVAREDRRGEVDAALAADAWSQVDASPPGREAALQQQHFTQLLAESQSRASSAYLALDQTVAQRYAQQIAGLRAGDLPVAPPAAGSGPKAPPPPPPPPPDAAGALGALHAALSSPQAEARHAAARPFAWECDRLALSPAAARQQDPRATLCASLVLRDLWLPVAWEIFDAAPAEELDRVAGLLPYLEAFGFSGESRLSLESVRERLREEESAATARLAAAQRPAERILLQSRCADLRETLAAVEAALAP